MITDSKIFKLSSGPMDALLVNLFYLLFIYLVEVLQK